MKIEYHNGIYFLNGVPRRAKRIRAMFPVECQRAVAESVKEQAQAILDNPRAIPAAIANAKRMVRKAEALFLEASIDEQCEVEWGARQAHS